MQNSPRLAPVPHPNPLGCKAEGVKDVVMLVAVDVEDT